MTWFQILTLVVTALGIPTAFGLIWKDVHEKKIANSAQAKEENKREQESIIRGVIKEEIHPIEEKVDNLSNQMAKIGDGTMSSLRNNIYKYYLGCAEKGYRDDIDHLNMHEMNESYRGLGGNSFIKDVMKRFDSLPTEEEYRKKGGVKNEQ